MIEGQLVQDDQTGEYAVYEENGFDWTCHKPVFYKSGKPVMEDDFITQSNLAILSDYITKCCVGLVTPELVISNIRLKIKKLMSGRY